MRYPRITIPLCLLSVVIFAFMGVYQPRAAYAQAPVGADDYEAPDDALPGETGTAPPTATPDQAGIHDGDAAAEPQPSQALPEGDLTVSVTVAHATADDIDLSDIPVVLELVRPPGPLQPDNFRQVAQSWDAVTNEDGVATFSDIPDNLSQQGLYLQATTGYAGLSFDSDYSVASDGLDIDLTIYDRAHEMPPIRVTRKLVLVSLWEEYLVIDQFWTFSIDGDRAFDIGDAVDPALERGLRLQLPMSAEGISFAGPGSHTVMNNNVFWSGVLTPNDPLTLQVRFSNSVRTSSYTFEQKMDFPVDEVVVLAPINTTFERISSLDDLVLRAPGFEVGSDPSVAGLQTPEPFLVATGRSVDAGESYAFRLDGLPFSRPLGGWIALFTGFLGALFLVAYGRREYKYMNDAGQRSEALDGLFRRRDAIFDELTQIELDLKVAEYDDEIFDLEEQQTILRQRLALILRKIDELEDGDQPSSQAA